MKTLLLLALSLAFAADDKKIADHIRESYNIPAGVEIKLGPRKASKISGFDEVSVEFSMSGRTQEDTVLLSKDGRWYVMGEPFKDLNSNPDQERVDKMKLGDGRVTRGNPKAPVTLVEYTDFQCPYCQIGYKLVRDQLMKDFPKELKWYYKSFPLKSIHPWAEPAAVAVECARNQGAEPFWKLHDLLFDSQKQINVRNMDDKFAELAKEAGADLPKFQACYDKKETLDRVREDMEEAEAIGLRSTPSFIVNGHVVSGADYDSLKRIVEESMKGMHASGGK